MNSASRDKELSSEQAARATRMRMSRDAAGEKARTRYLEFFAACISDTNARRAGLAIQCGLAEFNQKMLSWERFRNFDAPRRLERTPRVEIVQPMKAL